MTPSLVLRHSPTPTQPRVARAKEPWSPGYLKCVGSLAGLYREPRRRFSSARTGCTILPGFIFQSGSHTVLNWRNASINLGETSSATAPPELGRRRARRKKTRRIQGPDRRRDDKVPEMIDAFSSHKVEIDAGMNAALAEVAVQSATIVECIEKLPKPAQIITEPVRMNSGVFPSLPGVVLAWHAGPLLRGRTRARAR